MYTVNLDQLIGQLTQLQEQHVNANQKIESLQKLVCELKGEGEE